MEYEEIWERVKRMGRQERRMLACEMRRKGFDVGYVHPHYYYDAKAVHEILFYSARGQYEIDDKDFMLYQALKEIMEDDSEVNVCFKRYAWLPRFVNDLREGKAVRNYILSRFNGEAIGAYYRILPGDSLAGERPRSLFITTKDGSTTVYKMTACKCNNSRELMTFKACPENKWQGS